MTVIAAYADGRDVWMAADSFANCEGAHVAEVAKLFRVPIVDGDEALVGVSGTWALSQAIRYELQLSAPGDDLDEWAYDLACQVGALAKTKGAPAVDEDGAINGRVLLGYRGRLWQLEAQAAFAVGPAFAIGCADPEARGALWAFDQTGHLNSEPAYYVEQAVLAACHLDARCRPPVTSDHLPAQLRKVA